MYWVHAGMKDSPSALRSRSNRGCSRQRAPKYMPKSQTLPNRFETCIAPSTQKPCENRGRLGHSASGLSSAVWEGCAVVPR
jgi:hypothetical protein